MFHKKANDAIAFARQQALADRQRTVLQTKIDREYEKQRKAAERDIRNLDRPERIQANVIKWLWWLVLIIASIALAGLPLIPIAIYYLYKKNKKLRK